MSGYKVEEPNEEPKFYNNDNIEIREEIKISKQQYKRYNKVMYQLKDNWLNTYNTLKIMVNYGTLTEEFMNRVHKIYFLEYRAKIDYYNEEKIRLRQAKNYYSKKINKMKNKKYNL